MSPKTALKIALAYEISLESVTSNDLGAKGIAIDMIVTRVGECTLDQVAALNRLLDVWYP